MVMQSCLGFRKDNMQSLMTDCVPTVNEQRSNCLSYTHKLIPARMTKTESVFQNFYILSVHTNSFLHILYTGYPKTTNLTDNNKHS